MSKNTTPENTTPENTAPEVVKREYIINAPFGLRLRKNPNGEIITILPHKSGVFCAEFSAEEWLSVRTGELHGYVKSEFLKPVEDGDA